MATLFLYGTLVHAPLREAVLGRKDIALHSATLHDHAVYRVANQSFPLIVREIGAKAEGVLIEGLGREDVARLDYYEGGFGYELRQMIVETPDAGRLPAEVYFPEPGRWDAGAPWSLDDWVARHGALAVEAATDVLRLRSRMSATEAVEIWPFVQSRAWARLLAKDGAPTALRREARPEDVTLTERDGGHEAFFGLRRFEVSHTRFDGARSDPVGREAFVGYDCALVLPYDPATDNVLLVEQLRYGPVLRGDPQPWVLEPVAGLIDASESPETCARREAEEEAGLVLSDLVPILKAYPSPGYSSEFFHMFAALCDLSGRDMHVGGAEAESEDIRSHVMPLDDALALVDSGEITATPLAFMLFWVAARRDTLKAG